MNPSAGPTVVRIIPRTGWRSLGVAELWRQRWLVTMIAGRDIRVRYAQTAFGVAWVVLQPVGIALLLAVTIGRLAGVQSAVGGGYLAFVLAGMVPWLVFSHALVHTSNSLVDNERLITKVWFPRLVLPVASVLSSIIDLAIVGGLAAATAPLWGGAWSLHLLVLPVFAALALIAAFAVGIWLAAANVFWRDVRYALPFVAQIWMLATPVAWPTSVLPAAWRWIVATNPAAGPVLGFRWALVPGTDFPATELAWSVAAMMCLLVTGMLIFRRVEARFADAI